jgi:AcrR family transcriptional regulator
MSKSDRTKERILETAIELFNDKGTKAVTTNHIAAALGISPGNLYYHFRNKEAIIRGIFAQMHRVGLNDYQEINGQQGPGNRVSMEETFLMIQRFNWRYRFFKRELAPLVQNDPLLKEQFVASHRQHLGIVRGAIAHSIEGGFLRPIAAEQQEMLAEQIWMFALFWLNYLEVGGEEVNEASLQRGTRILQTILLPYLSDQAQASFRNDSLN